MTGELRVRRGASTNPDARMAARELYAAIAQSDMRLVVFHCSAGYDRDALADELHRLLGDVEVVGCTTAGEISPLGYRNDSLAGVSIASDDFLAITGRIDDLNRFEFAHGEAFAQALRERLESHQQDFDRSESFGFLLIDGMSMKEESVVGAISRGLAGVQLFGGSAGDGVRFGETYVYHEGRFRTDCAVVTLVHTRHPFVVFKTQHFVSSDDKMVVTQADPCRRIVTEINGEPAGREYARLVGLEVDELTPLIFATHPVIVKVGGQYYVRSIQKVNEDGSLSFFCAIDEGIVLTVARGVDLIDNLEAAFEEVRATVGEPRLTLGCDCILRHLELDQRGITDEVAAILERNRVVGFSTYGEQYNAMHVNQTFTGVAIGERRPDRR